MPRLHLVFSLILILSLMLTPSGTQAFDERTGRRLLLVANKGDRSVSIVDAESGRQVTTTLDNSVSVIDPHTLKIVGSIPTGQAESHMLAIARDGRRGYTANVGPGTVSVLDLEKRKTVKVIPVAGQIQRISLSVDDRSVFTSDQMKPRLAVIDTGTLRVKTW